MASHCVFVRALIAASVFTANASHAQQAPSAPAPIVVRAARMLDVESGRIVPNARVVVEGDRIIAVNPASLPANARTIDLTQRLTDLSKEVTRLRTELVATQELVRVARLENESIRSSMTFRISELSARVLRRLRR